MAHPYRHTPRVRRRPPVEPTSDRACLVVFLVLWLTSAARFASAVGRDEPMGFEPALALGITVVAPLAAAASRRGKGPS